MPIEYSLIFPTYNQEAHLERTLKMYDYFLGRFSKSYELIIVCSACTDKSVEIAEKFKVKNNNGVKFTGDLQLQRENSLVFLTQMQAFPRDSLRN